MSKTKQEIQKEIKSIDSQISKVEKQRKKLLKEFKKLPGTKGQQITHILEYGDHDTLVISYSADGILYDYTLMYDRHETVDLNHLIDRIAELGIIADNFQDELKVFEMFDIDPKNVGLTESSFKEAQDDIYVSIYSLEDFETLWNEIVEANVASFDYDW